MDLSHPENDFLFLEIPENLQSQQVQENPIVPQQQVQKKRKGKLIRCPHGKNKNCKFL
jgi:hypothetical protein